MTSPKKGHMNGVVPISQRGRQERGQGHVREGDGDGDGDGHSERGSCAYAWRKGKGQKSPRGRRDAFWVLDGTRCAEMGGCAAARRGEEATVEDPWKKHGETAVSRKPRASESQKQKQKQNRKQGQKQVKSAIMSWRAEEESPRSGRVQKKCTQ